MTFFTYKVNKPSGYLRKFMLVTKLTTVLLIAAILQASAGTYAQKVTLHKNNASLQSIFSEIRTQTGYDFLGDANLIRQANPINIQVKDVPLKEVLEQCFENQDLTYTIEEKTVVVKRKAVTFIDKIKALISPSPPPVIITGKVNNDKGGPLVGVSIVIKGTQKGVITDANGNYKLQVNPNDKVLIFSYVGMAKQEIEIKWRTVINVIMIEEISSLDEVQVIAYGTTTRRFSVGNVSTVTADEIRQQPVSNVMFALQGRVPGLLITPKGGGIPGAALNLQVRGQNTLQTTPSSPMIYSEPMIIVDGIPTAAQNQNQIQLLNSFIAGSGLSPINGINPADIESVSVLKDADATSIYGSQGANGVVIITTKRGKAGKTALNININTGPNSPTTSSDMLNTQQYLQLRHQTLLLDGISLATAPTYVKSAFPDLLNYDTTKYTNWAKKFFNRNPMNLDMHISLSGGSAENTYILSGGYTRSAYNFPGDYADNRYTLHSGAHHVSANHKFTLDFGTDISYNRNNSSVSSGPAQAMVLSPNTPDMLTPSGDLIWRYNGVNIPQMFIGLKQTYVAQIFNLQSSIKIDYELVPGLKVGILAGYSRSNGNEYSANPKAAQDPANYPTSSAAFGQSTSQSFDIEPQLNYRKAIGKGVFTALLGGTYKKRLSDGNYQTGSGYTDDAFLRSIQGSDPSTRILIDNSTIYKYVGAFARLNYIYNSRYIINLTGRRDGSSNFGTDHLFGNFASAGLGWIFSEEKALKSGLPFISFGKLAGNYGTNGSDGIAPYNYQPFWKIYSAAIPSQFQGTTPLIPLNLNNPDYSWASKRALSLSMDLGFFKDRILINGTWYQNRTINQVTSYPVASQAGFSTVVQNVDAQVQDMGLEFSVTTRNIQNKNFSWTTTFNISRNRNKLLAFPNLASSPYAGTYEIGKSIYTQYGFRYAGINATTGLLEYYKKDGTKASTGLSYTDDRVTLGTGEPDFYGGFGNTFTYKGLSVNLFFQFSKAYTYNYMAAIYNAGGGPGTMNNIPAFILGQIWQKPGDENAVFQRPTTFAYNPNAPQVARDAQQAANYFSSSTGAFSNTYYVRLKTVSISYQLPDKWMKATHTNSCNIFVNAQNVLTITNYKFGDPEMPGQLYGIPTQRVISAGLSFNF
jgi:TonB-dependent starch-binding outer membrane protein SusC